MQHSTHYFMDAGIILTLITLGKFLEVRSKRAAGTAIERMLAWRPRRGVVRDGVEAEVPLAEVRRGDRIASATVGAHPPRRPRRRLDGRHGPRVAASLGVPLAAHVLQPPDDPLGKDFRVIIRPEIHHGNSEGVSIHPDSTPDAPIVPACCRRATASSP